MSLRCRYERPPLALRWRIIALTAFAGLLAFSPAAGVRAQQASDSGSLELVDPDVFRACGDPRNLPFSNEKGEGFENKLAELLAAKLGKKDIHVPKLTLSPFYWGFDIGMNMSADDVYKMLTIVDKNADNLAKLDGDFAQIAGGKLAEFQAMALEQTWDLIPIHPGLARFLKEKGKWNPKWDSKVAAM
jgi:hypothetical protein